MHALTSINMNTSRLVPCPRVQEGWTALMVAAHTGQVLAVEMLLQRGADVNLRNKVIAHTCREAGSRSMWVGGWCAVMSMQTLRLPAWYNKALLQLPQRCYAGDYAWKDSAACSDLMQSSTIVQHTAAQHRTALLQIHHTACCSAGH